MRGRQWIGVAMGSVALAMFIYMAMQGLDTQNVLVDILGLLAFASPAIVGAYLAWRLPDNPVGFILAGFGLTFTLGVIGESLAAIDSPLTS
jgi:hypothetical protein